MSLWRLYNRLVIFFSDKKIVGLASLSFKRPPFCKGGFIARGGFLQGGFFAKEFTMYIGGYLGIKSLLW